MMGIRIMGNVQVQVQRRFASSNGIWFSLTHRFEAKLRWYIVLIVIRTDEAHAL